MGAPGTPEPAAPPRPAHRRVGTALIVLGIVIIVVDTLWIAQVANGPGMGPHTFADRRRGYDEVKVDLQRVFPEVLAFGLAGLGIALLGGRLRGGGEGGDEG